MKRLIIIALLSYSAVVVYLYSNQRKLIFKPRPFDQSVKYSAQDVYLKTSDGAEIHAWWVPSDKPIGVTLIYCHGNAAVLSSLVHVAEIFKDYGFDTLMLDYRGYGRSRDGELSEEGVVKDVVSAHTWVKKSQPIVLWGHSLGSSICANAGRFIKIDGLILEGAFTSIYDMARHNYPYVPIFKKLLLDQFDTASYLTDVPKLFIHAEHDSIVPIELGKKLYENAPSPKRWMTILGIDHNDFPDVAGQYKAPILEWVRSFVIGQSDVNSSHSE